MRNKILFDGRCLKQRLLYGSLQETPRRSSAAQTTPTVILEPEIEVVDVTRYTP